MKYFGIALLLLVFGTVALAACSGRSGSLEDTLWQMMSYRDTGGEMIQTLPDIKTTAEFKDGSISGKAACNTYNGSYQVNGDRISLGPLMSTMMACEPAAMDQETGYLTALDSADIFEVKGETLKIFNPGVEISAIKIRKQVRSVMCTP